MPDKCENCEYMVVKDRWEDYGDVGMPFCAKMRIWLDFYKDAPCDGNGGRRCGS